MELCLRLSGGQNTVMEHWGLDELVSHLMAYHCVLFVFSYRENDRKALYSRKITSKQKQERAEVREGFLEVERGSGKEIKNFCSRRTRGFGHHTRVVNTIDCPHLFRETETLCLGMLR